LDRIVEAAGAVLAAEGPDALTLDRVGEEVGLAKASLYHYVRSKDDLLALLCRAALDEVERRAGTLEDLEAPEALRRLIVANLSFGFDDPLARPLAAIQERVLTDPRMSRTRAELQRARDGLHALIERGTRSGSFRVPDVDLAADLVSGLLYAAMRRGEHWGAASSDDAAGEVASFALRGLGAVTESR
jgi:AcrR family transcriptional regulator